MTAPSPKSAPQNHCNKEFKGAQKPPWAPPLAGGKISPKLRARGKNGKNLERGGNLKPGPERNPRPPKKREVVWNINKR